MKELKTLTVGELKTALESFDDDMPVLTSYSYGDYRRTIAAGCLSDREIDEYEVKWSENLRTWMVPEDVYNIDEDKLYFAVVIGPKP